MEKLSDMEYNPAMEDEAQKTTRRHAGRPRTAEETHTRCKTVSVTEAQRAALTAYSMATGKTVSQLVDGWIREALDEGADV